MKDRFKNKELDYYSLLDTRLLIPGRRDEHTDYFYGEYIKTLYSIYRKQNLINGTKELVI